MTRFLWDREKELDNLLKHGVDFETAQTAFDDPNIVIYFDPRHSSGENRFFCFGKVQGKILTVRFTYRENHIRIIGAGYWRKGEKIYEKETKRKI